MFGCLRADHADNAVPLDHLAARTHLPDRRTNLHLRISLIRPRDRSVSASSTPTLSPARSRVKWVPARSATWARTLAPFSSSTRYTPLGRGSRTTPFTSEGRRGTNGDCTKAGEPSEFGVPTRRFAPTSPPGGEEPWPFGVPTRRFAPTSPLGGEGPWPFGAPTRRYAPTSPLGGEGASPTSPLRGEGLWPLADGRAVRMSGPASVIATVCSK